MPIFWRDKMSVNNDMIDRDHKYLVCLINSVELALREPEQRQAINDALQQLRDYTQQHFVNEERLMLSISYPRYSDQKQQHQALTESLEELIMRVEAEEDDDKLREASQELVPFLRKWLLDHVLKEDLLLAPYLAKYPSDITR